MEHRHIVTDDAVLTVAAAESILQRGKDADVVAMMHRLRREPFSQSADNALVAAENVEVYGFSAMVKTCLQRWRDGYGVGPGR